jgi:leader peptidase (prepilin peptidase)/N-methyltransferase
VPSFAGYGGLLGPLGVSPWLLRGFAFVWGCLWGSFVNVVVYRVPRGLSVVRPGSHCPACGAPVKPFDNLPLLSWAILGGRARCCGAKILPRYVVVEALGGLLSVGVLEAAARSLGPEATPGHAASVFLADFALAMALMAAAFIDAEHMYLPDSVTLGGTLFGLLTPALRGLGWADVARASSAYGCPSSCSTRPSGGGTGWGSGTQSW